MPVYGDDPKTAAALRTRGFLKPNGQLRRRELAQALATELKRHVVERKWHNPTFSA